MKTRDFSFDLPEELIAQAPPDRRENARLLCLNRRTGEILHRAMTKLPSLLPERALLIINDGRVRKARIYGRTQNGGRREFLFLRSVLPVPNSVSAVETSQTWMVLTARASRLRDGSVIKFPGNVTGRVVGRTSGSVSLRFADSISEEYFDRFGHVPLPPYIKREDEINDVNRYQTVYASAPGSVAAPTAGLHLTIPLLEEMESRGTRIARITLHVGLGTFLPVRSVEIEDHHMQSEEYEVSSETCEAVNAALRDERPIIAVGTTSVRTLESAFNEDSGRINSGRWSTNLYIRPGFKFNVISGMLTNFHTPKSTLLMLVSAFAGRESVLAAYRRAVELRYRFFSYGMLIQ